MVQRLTYRKRHSYATRSNQHRVVKTPGGKLVYQTTKKRASGPKCPVTGKRIQGSWFHGIIHGTEMGIISVVNHVSRCVTITHLAGRPEIGVVKSAQTNLKKLLTTKLIPRLIPWNGTETMGSLLIGIPHLRPTEYKRSRLPRNQRTVNRAYGGVLSGSAVRERIIRAFLVEEQKIVKKVLKIQKAKEKLASKS